MLCKIGCNPLMHMTCRSGRLSASTTADNMAGTAASIGGSQGAHIYSRARGAKGTA